MPLLLLVDGVFRFEIASPTQAHVSQLAEETKACQ